MRAWRGPAPPAWAQGAALAGAGLVAAATLARTAWLVRDALRPCAPCGGGDLPDLGPAVAALGTVLGLLYLLFAGLAALGLALSGPGRPWAGGLAVAAASLALGPVQGLEGRLSAPFFLINAACVPVVAALAAGRRRAGPTPSAGDGTRR